jgi:hypothetical protein
LVLSPGWIAGRATNYLYMLFYKPLDSRDIILILDIAGRGRECRKVCIDTRLSASAAR